MGNRMFFGNFGFSKSAVFCFVLTLRKFFKAALDVAMRASKNANSKFLYLVCEVSKKASRVCTVNLLVGYLAP